MRRFAIASSGLVVACLLAGCEAPSHDGDGAALPPLAKSLGEGINVRAAAMGPNGDVFFGGDIYSDADFGGGTLPHDTLGSVFLAHLDASGEHLWSGSTGSNDMVGGVAIGPGGELYAIGVFGGKINFGSGELTSNSGSRDGFFAAFEPGGLPARSFSVGGPSSDALLAVATTPTGELLVSGFVTEALDPGGDTYADTGHEQRAVVAYDRDGKHLWDQRFSGTDTPTLRLATAPSGDFYLAGAGAGTLMLKGQSFATGMFVASVSPAGEILWQATAGGDGLVKVAALGSDALGNVFVAGTHEIGFTFGSESVSPPLQDFTDVYLAKVSPRGEVLFVKAFSSRLDHVNVHMAVSPDGHVALAMTIDETIDFGSGELGDHGDEDAVVARFDPDGTLRGAEKLDGDGYESVEAVLIGPDGAPVVLGNFAPSLHIGDTHLTSATPGSMSFIARLAR